MLSPESDSHPVTVAEYSVAAVNEIVTVFVTFEEDEAAVVSVSQSSLPHLSSLLLP